MRTTIYKYIYRKGKNNDQFFPSFF